MHDDDDLPDGSEVEAQEQAALDDLGPRFLAALAHKDAARFDEAEEALRAILEVEPRLAEPRMELARVLLDTDRLDDAEGHAREALDQLDRTGPWTDEIPEPVVRAVAHALLAEILRRRADEDDVIFGDPEAFHALVREAKEQFEAAAALDPSDAHSSYHAFFLGPEGAARVAALPDLDAPAED